MTHTIVFVENSSSFEKSGLSSANLDGKRVFSFDISSHKILIDNNIEHEIADRLLSRAERKEIFGQCLRLWNWYEKISYKRKFEIEGINVLKIFDGMELHEMLMANLLSYFTCKKIIENENPKQIILSKNLYGIIKSLKILKNIEIITFDYDTSFLLPFDRFKIILKRGPISLSFTINRKSYTKLKRLFEEFVGTLLGLWPDKSSKKKIILFLEINPATYERLIKSLDKNNMTPIFFNHRRSAIWNFASIKSLKKSNGKLINERKLLKNSANTHHLKRIRELLNELKHDTAMNELYYNDGDDIWEIIKNALISTIENRLEEFVETIIIASESLKLAPKALILLYATGELERSVIESSSNKIPSVLIEHGYTNYLDSNAIYDASSMYSLFNDKIATWGKIQKQYLIEKRSIAEDRIILCGSPRHDDFFDLKIDSTERENKTITVLLPVIDTMSALNTTDTYISFEKTLVRIISKIRSIPNTKLMFKLHPAQDISNEWIRKIITTIDPKVIVTQNDSVSSVLQKSDAVIHLDVTGIGPSTTLLESLILQKPVLNIVLHDEDLSYEFIKDNACISCDLKSDVEGNIEKILFDNKIIDELRRNATLHVMRYLVNPGKASESLSMSIKNLINAP